MFTALLITALATAPCGPADCGLPNYEWRTRPDDPGRVYLFRGDVRLGGYDLAEGYYRPCDAAGNWGPAQAPPIPPPATNGAASATRAPTQPAAVTDFGVDLDKLAAGPERHVLTGQVVSREQAFQALSQD